MACFWIRHNDTHMELVTPTDGEGGYTITGIEIRSVREYGNAYYQIQQDGFNVGPPMDDVFVAMTEAECL